MTPNPSTADVQALLAAAGSGDLHAAERLFPVVYDELYRLAAGLMRGERPDHTLQPTALVNEAYMRLVRPGEAGKSYESRRHFIATAAVAMRRILISHAKTRRAAKRGAGQTPAFLDEIATAFERPAIDLLALDDALDRLAEYDPAQARLVELHFFGGMPFGECGQVLGLSERQVYYEWAHARAWLRGQLASG